MATVRENIDVIITESKINNKFTVLVRLDSEKVNDFIFVKEDDESLTSLNELIEGLALDGYRVAINTVGDKNTKLTIGWV